VRFRPLDDSTWPGTFTTERTRSPFSASWFDTLDLLARETEALGAEWDDVLVEVALDERHLYRDGTGFRANAPEPRHPGVVLSITSSRVGPLRFAVDRFDRAGYRAGLAWKANVRAVALGLEALRKVDRYGITSRAEQYRGWQELGAGEPMPAGPSPTSASKLLAVAAGVLLGTTEVLSPDQARETFRTAARHHHPDVGGDPEMFRRLVEARDLLAP
jgi:hypothetical protein